MSIFLSKLDYIISKFEEKTEFIKHIWLGGPPQDLWHNSNTACEGSFLSKSIFKF